MVIGSIERLVENQQRQQHFLAVVPKFVSMAPPLSKLKQPFSMCRGGSGCNSKLKQVENERSSIAAAAPKVDLTCCFPDAGLLMKLQVFAVNRQGVSLNGSSDD